MSGILGGVTTLTRSVCLSNNGKKRKATIQTDITTLFPGMHTKPSIGTYGNGIDLGDVDGNDNAAEVMEILEVQDINDTNNEAWAAAPASVPGGSVEVVEAEEPKEYMLKGTALTIAKGQKIIRAASGLFAGVNVAHNATPLPKLVFECTRACTATDYVRAKYLGLRTVYTA